MIQIDTYISNGLVQPPTRHFLRSSFRKISADEFFNPCGPESGIKNIQQKVMPACNYKMTHMSNEKNLRCLGYIWNYTTRFCGDYNKPS